MHTDKFYKEDLLAMAKINIPKHLLVDILREITEFNEFRKDNPFPHESEVRAWLEREEKMMTASRNMMGAPWLQSYGFCAADFHLLQHEHLEELWSLGLNPLDSTTRLQVRAVGEKLNDIGGFKAMQFNFVVLQGIVSGGAALGTARPRPAGVGAFAPFVSTCWSGVGEWMH